MEQYLPQFRLPNLTELLRSLELDHSEYLDQIFSSDVEDEDYIGDGEDDEEEEEDDDDDDDDEEDEMDQIGRLPTGFFSTRLSLDYGNWLFARYLAPHGEPSGLIPATEPENPPPIQHTDPRRRVRSTSTNSTPAIITEQVIRTKVKELKDKGFSDRERDIEIQRLMTENYFNRFDSSKKKTDNIRKDKITEQDRMPTFTPEGALGCEHYRRSCKIECSSCFKWYTCRMCHDAKEDHKLIRPATKHVICMVCGKDQNAGQNCQSCKKSFARYFCDVCKLWDDEPGKSIYHCDDCKICRIGEGLGIDLFHCKTCNVCMSIELQNNHRCIEHSTECDCPICGEFMFTSTEQVLFMKCGHSIHKPCYEKHVQTSYKCPTCNRTIINMEARFRILDSEIALEPLPDPYCNWRCIISCNDCMAKSNVPFHFLGLKCSNCRSYNTGQLKLIKPEELHHQPQQGGGNGHQHENEDEGNQAEPRMNQQQHEPAVDRTFLTETVNLSDLPSDYTDGADEDDEDYNQAFQTILNRVTMR